MVTNVFLGRLTLESFLTTNYKPFEVMSKTQPIIKIKLHLKLRHKKLTKTWRNTTIPCIYRLSFLNVHYLLGTYDNFNRPR